MTITKMTSKSIFAYMDYTFFIFDKNKLITLADDIGVSWAGGKVSDPAQAPIDKIKRGTCYHNAIMMTLIDIAEKQITE